MYPKDFRKQLLRLVIPLTLQQLMVSLVSFTDAIMLGFLNQDSLSAVSLAGQVQFVFGLFIFAVTGGMSILAAQYWGIRATRTVEKILGIGLKVLILISLPFTLGARYMPQLLMRCFTAEPTLIEMGSEYLRTVAFSYLLLGISQPCLCILKNCGHAGKSSLISSVAVVLNILLNWLLIFGIGSFPRMGIRGAACATVLSKAIELGWTLIICAKSREVKMHLHDILQNDPTLRRDYWKYALPVLGNQLVWGIGFTMYSVILGHLGSDAAAANSIANIVKNLTICVCEGVASASAVLVGAELGKGALENAKAIGAKLCHISLLCGVASGGIILCIIPFVPLFSTLSPTAQGYLKVMLIVSSYYVVGKAMNMTVISGIFPSGGDSRFGFLCDAITMWCVTVPLGLLVAFCFELPVLVVYCMIHIDEIIKLPAVYQHYRQYHWLHNLTHTA